MLFWMFVCKILTLTRKIVDKLDSFFRYLAYHDPIWSRNILTWKPPRLGSRFSRMSYRLGFLSKDLRWFSHVIKYRHGLIDKHYLDRMFKMGYYGFDEKENLIRL